MSPLFPEISTEKTKKDDDGIFKKATKCESVVYLELMFSIVFEADFSVFLWMLLYFEIPSFYVLWQSVEGVK